MIDGGILENPRKNMLDAVKNFTLDLRLAFSTAKPAAEWLKSINILVLDDLVSVQN